MKPDSKLASKIESGDFVVTAECLPRVWTDAAALEACVAPMRSGVTAVNMADNHYGIALSSLAASVAAGKAGVEPIFQLVTRDRNRIALQSDLLGAAFMGVKNVLCLSGYHQSLTGNPSSANVYDIDSIQLISVVKKMNESGALLDGTKIEGKFSMLVGAAANPLLKPLELNILRMKKKAAAGANFVQTQAVFDVGAFKQWLEAVDREGITRNVAVLAGVMPLASAAEAKRLNDTFTDFQIPAGVISRMEKAGNEEAQKKEGLAICVEVINAIKGLPSLRGIHILSGGNEAVVPQIVAAIGK